jgi:hypothetical protein
MNEERTGKGLRQVELRTLYIANTKFTSSNNIKILNRLWEEICVIFIELCMKEDNFVHLKGKNHRNKYNFKTKFGNGQLVY